MKPEFAAWLVSLAETLGKGFAIFCAIVVIVFSIFGIFLAIAMQNAEK
jgi:hypothetical protein